MPDQTAQVDDLRLVALPSAVNCADLFVRFTLVEWHVQSMLHDARDTTKLLVQAVVGDADPRATPSMLMIRLRLTGNSLAIEIVDDRATPRLAVPAQLAGVHGGVTVLAGGRQLMWCELPLPTGMDATVVPLPRRGTTTAGAPRQDVDINNIDDADDLDPAVMQRILDALRRNPGQQPPQ